MNTTIKHALWGAALAGGITLLGATAANAADNTTSGQDGTGSGSQVVAPITAPIGVQDNSITVIGDSSSSGSSAPSGSSDTGDSSTDGQDGLGSGSQIVAPATIPVAVTGNSITVVGDSTASGTTAPAGDAPQHSTGAGTASTDGADGTASGTQVVAPLHSPVGLGGNAITVIGDPSANGAGGSGSGSTGSSTGAPTTSGQDGTASGTQVAAPVSAPVSVSRNAITVVGDPSAQGSGGSSSGSTGSTGGSTTSGQNGTASGTQVVLPITAPVSTGGNAITVIGDPTTGSNPGGSTPGGPGTTPGAPGQPTASGPSLASLRSGAAVLASTGLDGLPAMLLAALGALLAAGGGLLIRRRA